MFSIDPVLVTLNPFVVYTLHDRAGAIQFIGISKFTSVLATPDARANPLFNSVFPQGSVMTIKIIMSFQKKTEAQNYLFKWMQSQTERPFMMKYGARMARSKPVRCIETGELYPSVSEASRLHGITQPFMSNHLRRRTGFERVRGKTFEWVV